MSNEQGQVKAVKAAGAKPGHINAPAKKVDPAAAKRKAEYDQRQAARSAKKAEEEKQAESDALRAKYASKRVRHGKTRKDRASGAMARNAENKYSRAAWQGDTKGSPFPVSTCNGQRNRYRVTGKGGETVFLKSTASASGRR